MTSPRAAATVVVPTRDRPERLGRCLEALAVQTLPPEAVVVVDDGSQRPAAQRLLAMDLPIEVRILRTDRSAGPAAARNLGWRAATSALIAFTDDDCRPEPRWLEALIAATPEGAVGVGRTVPDPDDGRLSAITDRTVRVDGLNGGFLTCNALYPRALLERLGGFDESFRRHFGEDTDLGQRALAAGAQAVYAEAAVVRHAVHRLTVGALLRDRVRLREQPRLVRRHPALRRSLFAGPFAYGEHRALVATLAGLALLPVTPAGAAAVGRYWQMCAGRARALGDAPGPARLGRMAQIAALDAFEVAVCTAGSVRNGTVLL